MKSNLPVFCFCWLLCPRNNSKIQCSEDLLLSFFMDFTILTLKFRSLVHFELILYTEWGKDSILFFYMRVSCCPGLPDGSVVKNPPANPGRPGVWSWVRKIPWRRNGNPLQYICLENSSDRGAWSSIVHGATKSWTRLSNWECTHASCCPSAVC